MSRQPKDENNNAIPILPLKASGGQKVTIAAASARSTAVTTQAITLHANCNCYVEIGDSTVTLAHSRTKNIKELTLQADIIISALGVPNFVTEDMVKDGVVIVDVGITRVKNDSKKGYEIVGDVDYVNVSKKASFITPVPGGVGPMTIAMLLKNTLQAKL